jgi:hypothetical protein
MPTGVYFARVWTPVWILTSHWIVLYVKLKLILWSKISPRRSWRLISCLCLWFVQIVIVITPELRLRISWNNALRRIAQRTKNAGQIREFEIHNKLVRDMCVGSETGPLMENCAHCDRATNHSRTSRKSSRTSAAVCHIEGQWGHINN